MDDVTATCPPAHTALAEEARVAFLRRYTGPTRELYEYDMRIFYTWCAVRLLDPLAAKRIDLERFAEHLSVERHNRPTSVSRRLHTLRGFYALAYADELIHRDPTVLLRMPRVHREPERLVWLDRFQVGALLHQAEQESPDHHALLALMAMLGLRVSAACRARLEDCRQNEVGEWFLHVREKGGRTQVVQIPGLVMSIIDAARDGRTEGTIIRRRDGQEQTRNGAYTWVRTLSRKAGLPVNAHPHSLRRAAISLLLDAGVPIQDVSGFAGHADSRTTEAYHPRRGATGVAPSMLAAAAFSAVA